MSGPPATPRVVGLVGGIASGKSTVAALFAEAGLHWIDADRIARAVTARPEVLAAIRARFGDAVFPGGTGPDRAALARVVFADPDARADLEAITHPAIRAAIRRELDGALARGETVLLDVPLLLEGEFHQRCDAILFVDAPEPVRLERAARRGWDAAELRRREAAQLPLAVKKARATASIENAADLSRTRAQVRRLLEEWRLVRPRPPG